MNRSSFELEDMISSYPPAYAPGIQTVVTGKKEFADLASSPFEPTPAGRGTPFKHQKLIGRLMIWLDRLLLIHGTGTGKTCSVAAITEYYKKLRDHGGHIRRAYVLVKGPTLKQEFKRQIQCICTAGDYITELVQKSKTIESRKSNTTREIKKWYSIKTYLKFANKLAEPVYEEYTTAKGKKKKRIIGIKEKLTNAEIMRRYSNCIFFVDEVHNLHVNPEDIRVPRGGRRRPPTPAVIPEDEDPDADVEAKNTTRFTYDQLWRLFHHIERSKVILASATPMVNEVSEVGSIMNLILPANFQIPDNFNYNTATLAEMEPYFRNRISYVRARDSGAIPEEMGVPLNTEYTFGGKKIHASTKVYESPMLRYKDQQTGREMGQDVGYQNAAATAADFYIITRHAADFVFPDNSYGSAGFHRYIRETKKEKEPEAPGGPRFIPLKTEDRYMVTDEFYQYISNLDNLRFLSAKFSTIAQLCRDDPGNCYVYSDFVQLGADLLGIVFEGLGFEKYTGSTPVFEKLGGLPPVCPSPSEEENRTTNLRPSDGKTIPYRYALLTSGTTQAQADNIKNAFNSFENRHGEIIKVVIGSLITREGISLSNVLQIHLASAGWNPSSIYQATSRAIRATSHDALLEEETVRLVDEAYDALTPAQIEEYQRRNIDIRAELRRQAQPKIIVKIYKHVAVSTEQHRIPEGTTNSIDRYMYERSERKEIDIKRMERMMKQCAVDCQIHYQRNVRDTDVDFSPTCDYEVCHYECVNPAPPSHDPKTYELTKPELLDRSTYDVYYSDEVISEAEKEIINIFRYIFSASTRELYETLSEIPPKFIDFALAKIMREKRPLLDRFGFVAYLREDKDILFLQHEYPMVTTSLARDKYSLGTYTANLIAIETSNLANQLSILQVDEQSKLVEELKKTPPDSEHFDDLLEQFNIENRVRILEEAIYEAVVNDNRSPYVTAILDRFKNVYSTMHEPTAEIQAFTDEMTHRGTARGRKPKSETKIKTKRQPKLELPEIPGEEGPLVYIHNLYGQLAENVAYATTARFNKAEGRIRILKPEEGVGWRDTNPYETPVYNALIQRELERRIAPYEQNVIYGTLLHDKIFRIRNKLTENPELVAKDARVANRGRECKNWKRAELFDILWSLKVPPPETVTLNVTDRNILIPYLLHQKLRNTRAELEALPDDQLQFYYLWVRSGAGRKAMCTRIQRFMEENNLLFVE